MSTAKPELKCRPLPKFNIENWAEIEKVFSKADKCMTGQTWLPQKHPDFQPAEIRTGWRSDALYIYAKLTDMDIYNDERAFNAASFTKGDVFEIFFRPVGQDAYFEIHVSPFNQKFQIRLPEKDIFKKKRPVGNTTEEQLAEYFINEPIESRTRILKDQNRWEVLAILPFRMFCEKEQVKEGSEWLFSFSRYDYYKKLQDPVHSSTSPHAVLGFHAQEDWGKIYFT